MVIEDYFFVQMTSCMLAFRFGLSENAVSTISVVGAISALLD